MTSNNHYDVIIIGTGAGGGTLAYKLAPSGKKILLLERGDYVPREKDNWSTRAVNLDGKYNTKEAWRDADGKELHPHTNNAAEFTAPHETTTISPEYSSRAPFRSTITLLTSRALPLVSSRSTFAFVINETFSYSSAGSTQIVCASDLAPIRHGWPSHVLQRIHGLFRALFSLMRMPKGT